MSNRCMAAVTAAVTSGLRWPEVVGAAVEVDVDQALALDVVDEVALAPVDDQRDAGVDPELGLARVPVLPGPVEHLGLGREGDQLLGHVTSGSGR